MKNDAQREKLTTQLREWVTEYDAAHARCEKLLSCIYDHTYLWVSLAVDLNAAKTVDDGITRLAGTLKRARRCVQSWYYFGRFMAENKLQPHGTDQRSVRVVYENKTALTKADQLQCVQLIRDKAPHEMVTRIIRRSSSVLAAQADRKAATLEKRGQLTKTRVRMEMLALLTLCRKFYGRLDIDVTVVDERGNVLERTGGRSKSKAG